MSDFGCFSHRCGVNERKRMVRTPKIDQCIDIVSGRRIGEFRQGKRMMLHFMTGGCVNCMHVVAEMARIEIPEDVVVVGVHTGKFDREKEDAFVHEFIRRHGISHPVLNDADGKLWDAFAVRAWPTLILVSGDGYELARASGEGKVTELLDIGSDMEKGALEAKDKRESRFSRVYANGKALWLSDSGLGGIRHCSPEGKTLRKWEGFGEPQGVFERGSTLYVADRLAGEIVAIDLRNGEKSLLARGLRSPWGVTGNENGLQVTETGSHRIVQIGYDGSVEAVAGIGAEGVREGDAKTEALFAQPTDLDWLDEVLYVVDAEGSALRTIVNGRVETPIGWDLFTFGDRDGIGETVRLQHPEGVCAGIGGCGNHRIFICDTYNDKVKVYDPLNGRVTTLMENLHMPTGICKSGCYLFVTDAQKGSVVRFDISTMRYERLKIE